MHKRGLIAGILFVDGSLEAVVDKDGVILIGEIHISLKMLGRWTSNQTETITLFF